MYAREGQKISHRAKNVMHLGSQIAKIRMDNQMVSFNIGPYGYPLNNKNFENRASSCFKLAQISPRPKIGTLVALENVNRQFDLIGHC